MPIKTTKNEVYQQSINTLSHEILDSDSTEGSLASLVEVAVLGQHEGHPHPIYQSPTPLTNQVPTRPAYKDNHAVPWRFEPLLEGTSMESKDDSPIKEVTNIARAGGMERSESFYPSESGLAPQKTAKAPKDTPKGKEAEEFLKLIWYSEYELLEQMNKTLARISLLSLLLISEGHQNLLLKVLKEAHVAQDITMEKFAGIINNITSKGVLIDNGLSLNVLPKTTLDKLCSINSQLRTSSVVVREFDGSKREVMGEITLPIYVGPAMFNIAFQVMDICLTYKCLLGRPWIHMAEVVPSSLHQKVKFIANHQLINVMGEKELSLEFTDSYPECPASPPTTERMAFRVMVKEGYQLGKGLGPHLNGIPISIAMRENKGKARLGYQGGNSQDRDPDSGNAILMLEDPSPTDEPIKDEGTEAEALVEVEKWIECERPKF
ncbi:hypothetical protein CR513_06642, partial [Mucuna pruriens]